MNPLALTVAVVVLVGAVPAALTAVGQRRRGSAWTVAVPAGVVFPVTWAVWYAVDELPRRRPRRERTVTSHPSG